MNEQAKNLMEEGWKARENLEFDKAEKLLNEALELFENNEDWFNVTETLNHLVYTQKLRAVHHIKNGLELAEKSESIATQHDTKKSLILRAQLSMASAAGLFEHALKLSYECLNETSKPLAKADMLSHIATFKLRTGNILEAENTINEAEAMFMVTENWEQEREPHRSTWKSRMVATKGLILYNKGSIEDAKKHFLDALEIAQQNDLKTRVIEIQELLKLVNN